MTNRNGLVLVALVLVHWYWKWVAAGGWWLAVRGCKMQTQYN